MGPGGAAAAEGPSRLSPPLPDESGFVDRARGAVVFGCFVTSLRPPPCGQCPGKQCWACGPGHRADGSPAPSASWTGPPLREDRTGSPAQRGGLCGCTAPRLRASRVRAYRGHRVRVVSAPVARAAPLAWDLSRGRGPGGALGRPAPGGSGGAAQPRPRGQGPLAWEPLFPGPTGSSSATGPEPPARSGRYGAAGPWACGWAGASIRHPQTRGPGGPGGTCPLMSEPRGVPRELSPGQEVLMQRWPSWPESQQQRQRPRPLTPGTRGPQDQGLAVTPLARQMPGQGPPVPGASVWEGGLWPVPPPPR